jgi:glycosyltransferase involved in cell wall biosynthesis
MVRVLNIISDTNIGGAGNVLVNYLKYADRSAFETLVGLPAGSLLAKPLREAGAAVYELDISADKSFDLKDVKKLKALIRETSPDIVHTHGSLSGRIAGRQCGRTVLYTRHCVFPVSPRMKKGPGRLLNKLVNEHYADRIIAISPAAKVNLTDTGIREDLIDVIMNGVEPLTRKSEEDCRALRDEWGIRDGSFITGILARLEEYKGHRIILDAVKALKDDGVDVTLLVAGSGSCEDALRQETVRLGLEDRVKFLGFLSDVSAFLSVIDVQLNASYGTETSSLSLLEGLSIGVPAIVSDYGGNPYVVDHNVDGLVFKSRDSADLAACIRRLQADPALLASMKTAAAAAYQERFTGAIFAGNIEQIYSKALKDGGTHGK